MQLRTSLAARWTSKSLALLIWALLGTGCAALERPIDPPPILGPREEVFFDDFDKVWRCAQLALQRYPMKINNMDKGLLETDKIKGYSGWTPPHKPEINSGGRRYYISLRVIKGSTGRRPANKVTIYKYIEFQKDFFSEPERIPSDGLEEKVILYRIARELEIDRALSRAVKRMNRSN